MTLETHIAGGILATFMSGAYIEAMIDIFYVPMGYWFFAALYLGFLLSILLYTKSPGSTAVVAMLISFAIVPLLPPGTYFFIAIAAALCLFAVIWALIHR